MTCRLACLALLVPSLLHAAEPTYWQDVRPLLRKHCVVCHSARNLKEADVSGGLALDTYETARGARHLVERLRAADEAKRMPKDAPPLPPAGIALIESWLRAGAAEGTRPDLAAAPAAPATARRTRYLDVALPAPAHLRKPELVLPVGPLAPVTAVAFAPDGTTLVSGAYGRVTVWDLATGRPARVLTGVLGAVHDLRFSPDGRLLAVAGGQPSFRGDLRLFDTATGQPRGSLGGHEDVVFTVAWSPDGRRLASASFDKTVRVWDVATQKPLLTFGDHSDFVYGVAFRPDGQALASCSKDRSVKVFDAATGKGLVTCSGMSEDVLTVAFSPDGRSLVSSGHEAGIHWWNPQTAERVRLQGGHGVAVHELCFSKDGQLLASAGGDGTARLWDGASGAPVRTLAVGAVTYAVALSPDARFAATGSFDGLVRLWDVKDGRLLVTLLSCAGPGDQAAWVALTPEGYAQAGGAVTPAWRVNGQAAPDALGKDLAQPALVARALRGEPLPPAK